MTLVLALAKFVSLTNIAIPIWVLWYAIVTSNVIPLIALTVLHVLVAFLKKVLAIPRPCGAKGCDAFGIKGEATTYGMPSGHVATAVFGWMLIAKWYGYNELLFGLLSAIIMAWSRVTIGCHTIEQGLAGGVVGGVVYFLSQQFTF